MFTVTKDAEIKLVDTVGGIAEEGANWRAVYFRFDELLEQYRSDYQVQIAVNLLNDLLVAHQGGVFVCNDRTIILVCRNVTKAQIDKAIFQLRYLFMDDPLAYDGKGDESPRFCRVFDLGVEYAEFYQLCRKKLSQNSKLEQHSEYAVPRAAAEETAASAKALTASRLARIEHDLNKADLSRVLRRQPICALMPDYDVRRVFDEYYINITALRQMLRTEADFFSNRWLFRYLTQLLDERMLSMLSMNAGRYFDVPVSLNFNIETILSRMFNEFDAAIKPALKVSIVIEINIGDVFNDVSAFIAARKHLQKLGYKVCLDGLTSLSIDHINREALGFDLAKLQWNADSEKDLKADENQAVFQAVKRCGVNRVILCRCDTRQAVNYGQAMGINLFQGRFLDRIINPTQKVEN
jgi:EAL domain-containing protein (putative c-di-GMP-specific phosphodiesterase class I)